MNITDIDDKVINKARDQQKPFEEISRHFETEFLDDMRRLNVGLPDAITRVTEYVPEIVAYIEKIIENGYAYAANGSVYFDVGKFGNHQNHKYAKLEPTSAQDIDKLAEGEGANQVGDTTADKKNPQDFALWKKVKEGEPSWDSPWGQGRPGWHIECSAMASAIFKKFPIDIHSGGIDLRFPHHDNEIAQAEAYYDCDQWINHFWHTGHLHIDGLKMSKSLKNFITIKQILKDYSARQIRMMFLLHNWDTTMNYNKATSFNEATAKDTQFTQFFRNVKAKLRCVEVKSSVQKWADADYQLSETLLKSKTAVHEALSDSFDTPTAINELNKLVIATNTYLAQPDSQIKIPLVKQVSKFIHHILRCFGLYSDTEEPADGGADESSAGSVSREAAIEPLMNVLAKFRDDVKANAGNGPKEVFQISDVLRDDVLPHHNIMLEDRKPGEPAIWKFVDYGVIMAEREEKLRAKQKKEEEKRLKKELDEKKKSTPASEWFKSQFKASEGYSKFDEQGIPTHQIKEKKGKKDEPVVKEEKELPDAIRNKLKKEWNKQDGIFKKW